MRRENVQFEVAICVYVNEKTESSIKCSVKIFIFKNEYRMLAAFFECSDIQKRNFSACVLFSRRFIVTHFFLHAIDVTQKKAKFTWKLAYDAVFWGRTQMTRIAVCFKWPSSHNQFFFLKVVRQSSVSSHSPFVTRQTVTLVSWSIWICNFS